MSTARDPLCFVCGSENASSLGVVFHRADDGHSFTTCSARPEHDGWPAVMQGGVLFSLLDDAVGWAARFSGTPTVTAKAEIRYRKSVPTNTRLLISARITSRGRVLTAEADATCTETGVVYAEFSARLFPLENVRS